MSRKLIGFSFYVELPTQVSGTPEVRRIINTFDYAGDLITLERLLGESNPDYKKRLWDVSVHPGGPTYEGVLNSLARDLGFLREPAIRIDLKLTSGGDLVAPSPRVDILANKVVLYSDWRPGGTAVIDREIRIYQLGDTGYYLDDLVTAINQSPYFSAVMLGSTRPNTISSTLVRGTSNYKVDQDYVRGDKLTKLTFPYIVRDSLAFIEKDIFQTEVAGDPTTSGEYAIDYVAGEVEAYTVPSGNGFCSYQAALFPMDVDIVPIQIFTLQDDDFLEELFHQVTLDSGENVNGLPNTEGAETLHQLFKETQVFWGE